MNFLQGKKTYILVVIGAIVWAAQTLGWITPDVATSLLKLLGLGAVATLRSAMSE